MSSYTKFSLSKSCENIQQELTYSVKKYFCKKPDSNVNLTCCIELTFSQNFNSRFELKEFFFMSAVSLNSVRPILPFVFEVNRPYINKRILNKHSNCVLNIS